MKKFLIALLIVFSITASTAFAQELVIHCINVGQGDCTLIESPSGKTMMVDNGPYSSSGALMSYLNGINVNHLNWLIVTHYHSDHIGGTQTLVQQGVQIDSVFDRGWHYCTTTYNTYYAGVIGNVRHTVDDGRTFDLGDGVTARVVSVNGNGLLNEPYVSDNCSGGGPNDENDFSVALVVSCGNFDFYVGGDLSGTNTGSYTDIETSVAPEVGDVEVYQVNHHGSYSSSNQFFLDTIDPEVSILSLGNNNYGHPHSATVQRLLATSVIYQTEDGNGNIVDGDIVIRTPGSLYFAVNSDTFDLAPTGIVPLENQDIPKEFILLGNYPNPFNATTSIRFRLQNDQYVSLVVYDLLGRERETLIDGEKQAGTHSVIFNGSRLSSGIYFYRLRVGATSETKRMILLK